MQKLNKTEAKKAIDRWWSKHSKRPRVGRIRHVHGFASVVGYAAPACLVVKLDHREAEKHMREWEEKHPLTIVRQFDRSLKFGDSCFYGYVSTADSGECVAVKPPQRRPR